MQKSRWLIVLLVAILALSMVSQVSAQRLPRNETVWKAGLQWGAPTSFNPFGAGSIAWPIGSEKLIYETLFVYNILEGDLDPLLAESREWINDDMTLRVVLREGTTWQDGQPLTSEDIVYTFELSERYTTSWSAVWNYMTEIVAVDERTIDISLNPERPHRAFLENFLSTHRIAPKHIWTEIEAADGTIRETPNMEPVGSGPFKLMQFNPEMIVLEQHDEYWGFQYFGDIAPRYIAMGIFSSNDAANLALERGTIDFSQTFIPEVWRMWEDAGRPVKTWYDDVPYHLPASIPSIYLAWKYPLDIPEVRRAIAYSIDYARIAETAMSRYSLPKEPGLIIHEGSPEAVYFSEEDAAAYGWEFNPAEAVRLLEEELGATKGSDGIYVLPDGTRLGPWDAVCPYGWTDWMTALEIVAAGAQAVGIDIRTNFPEAPVRTDMLQTGNFDIILDSVGSGYGMAHPWERFRVALDSRELPEIGQTAFHNYARYKNEEVHEILDRAGYTTDEEERAQYLRELNRIVMHDIPVIGLMYRPWDFYTVSEHVWTNWPDADNPTAPPNHQQAGIWIYYQIEPVE